ncbi:BCCT family transporter [Vibrio sp. SCSIO 43140]|uniref:BCCT family transporter n=1 Tax=Vibrio sp. SCSIO 43140 TaxID=2819100 RepID=UPI002075BDAB|nr:BCCT family transporter [Vibrio sp. SCSIO 43140]USD59205.1 BCCT family transporter [Vibrio sp. SCSIO 43140]
MPNSNSVEVCSAASASSYDAIHPPERLKHFANKLELNNPVFWLSASFLTLFVLLALSHPVALSSAVNSGFNLATRFFGAFWQLMLVANFLIGLALCFGRTGDVRLGGKSQPEIENFKWISIILCTLLAGGGVFWAAAEPIAHYLSPPPLFGSSSPQNNAINALSQSFVHWGFLAWAVLGGLSSIVLMHLHYDKSLPLKPRTLLYPLLGKRAVEGWIGNITDALSIIAVAAGTIGPIGFLGLQISYAMQELFSIPDTFATQATVVVLAVLFYTLSALTGVNRGIQLVSRYNVLLAAALILFILIAGPTEFIIDSYVQGLGTMVDQFIPMAMYRGDPQWLGWWTVFFWGWFIGYAPMMAIFIARISRGRSIRQLILSVSIAAPLVTCFWFTIVGGSGLAFELETPGIIQAGFEGFNMPGALLAITMQLPFPVLISILFLILTTTFIVTTGDSMTYTITMVITGDNEPNALIRAFWGLIMGAVAIVLISMGSGGVSALQSFIVITAVPASLIIAPSLWFAPKIANQMAREQNIQLNH